MSMNQKDLETAALASPGSWISKRGFADILKVSTGTVEGWMCRYWTRGEHYTVIGRTTLINTQKVAEWIYQEE